MGLTVLALQRVVVVHVIVLSRMLGAVPYLLLMLRLGIRVYSSGGLVKGGDSLQEICICERKYSAKVSLRRDMKTYRGAGWRRAPWKSPHEPRHAAT